MNGRRTFLAVLLAASLAAVARADPAVRVTATYPGASAQVADESVARPLDKNIWGAEGVRHVWTECRNDGSVTVTAYLKPRTDVNFALVLVQNRVALTEPVLPDVVRQRGILTEREGPGRRTLLWLTLSSRDRPLGELSDPTERLGREHLLRIPGVTDAAAFGAVSRSVRIWIDTDKLAACGLTAADVAQALRGRLQPLPELRLPGGVEEISPKADPKTVGDVVVKTSPQGGVVYLRDVARVEVAESGAERAWVKGVPAVAVRVSGEPAVVKRVREGLPDMRKRLPPGVTLDLAADLTAGDVVRAELFAPAGAAPERVRAVAEAAAEALGGVEGVEVLLATGGPDAAAALLLRVAGTGRERADRLQAVRGRLGRVKDASFRLADPLADALPPPRRFPLTVVVQAEGHGEAQQTAEKLRAVVAKTPGLADVRLDGPGPVSQMVVDIDRAKAAALGVTVADANALLRLTWGDPETLGPGYEVRVAPPAKPGTELENVKRLKVRSAGGEMVPFTSFATVRTVEGPAVVTRLDGRPTALLTAEVAPGASPEEARKAVREAVEGARLPEGVRVLLWGRDLDEAEEVTPKR
jgi:multidrug efflux pump subunit AcrB